MSEELSKKEYCPECGHLVHTHKVCLQEHYESTCTECGTVLDED